MNTTVDDKIINENTFISRRGSPNGWGTVPWRGKKRCGNYLAKPSLRSGTKNWIT